MKILVTGATGQLGRAVVPRLLARGHSLALLARDPAKAKAMYPSCEALRGDVAEPGLGLAAAPAVDAVLHMAADVNLGSSRGGRLEAVNYGGTVNAAEFCLRGGVRRLFYAGTAYTEKGRNPYERSKKAAEEYLRGCAVPEVSVFKIGILVPGEAEAETDCDGAFYKIVGIGAAAIGRTGQRDGVFRVRGRTGAATNLLPADAAGEFIAGLPGPGTFWVTHPAPLRLHELAPVLTELLGPKIVFEEEFEATPGEALFARLAASFMPYLSGDDFPSDLPGLPPVTREFLLRSLRASLRRSGLPSLKC